MKKLVLAALSYAVCSSAAPAADTVCYVSEFSDTAGCKPGDHVLYLPHRWGSEQLPIEFVAKKCDLSKSVAWTKGGVACVFAGPKAYKDGAEEVQRISYAAKYEEAQAHPEIWQPMSDGSYWRIFKQGEGEPLKIGDRVRYVETNCSHDLNGNETLGKPAKAQEIDAVSETHYLFMIHPNSGATIEAVWPNSHLFVQLEVVKPKSKPQKNSSAKKPAS